jgi:uncharacterized membrane protein YbhN (UPF0104 family)
VTTPTTLLSLSSGRGRLVGLPDQARRWLVRLGAGAVLLLGPVWMLGALPRTAGASWHDVLLAARSVSLGWLLVLVVVWWAGLLAHSLVLTSSLPGLTSRRAVSLNLAGSAVANSVPLGGAVSMGVTTAMARSWGFAPVALGAFLTVSAIVNFVIRLLVGLVALSWLAFTQTGTTWRASGWMLFTAGAAALPVLVAFARERSTARLGALAGRSLSLVRRHSPALTADRSRSMALAFIRVRRQTMTLIRRSWQRLSVGMVGYLALLCLLLDLCLRAIGSPQPLLVVVAAVGVERLASAVPITPGGAGVAELGLVGSLTVCGVSPVTAVAATLLFRLFTFFLEIPVGLLVAAGWGLGRRRARTTNAVALPRLGSVAGQRS